MISPYFSRTTFSPVVNKPAVSAFRVPEGYVSIYFNRCRIFTREDYWEFSLVSSTLFSSNLKKEHLSCSILANYPYSHVKDDSNRPIFHFLDHIDYLYRMKYKDLK